LFYPWASGAIKLGDASHKWISGHFENLYTDELNTDVLKINGATLKLDTLYATNTPSYCVTLNSSFELAPNTAMYAFDLGNSSFPWTDLHIKNIYHKSGTFGVFGKTPVTQKSLTKLLTSATLSEVITKVNALIDIFGDVSGYGFINI
jgi:hypothetical protein